MLRKTQPRCMLTMIGTALLLFIATLMPGLVFAEELSYVVDKPVVKSKSETGLPMATYDFLVNRNADTARVWVYFTDKGVFTKAEFDTKAAAVRFSDKVLRRRAKTGTDKVLFIDLPVVPEYIDEITARGGTLRHISKWLNAASFDVPIDKLNEILQLPFVTEIKPVAGFKRPDEPTVPIRPEDFPTQSLAPDALNYGISQAQLEQIHVPAVHNMGYDGSGVTLAIFDTGYRKSH